MEAEYRGFEPVQLFRNGLSRIVCRKAEGNAMGPGIVEHGDIVVGITEEQFLALKNIGPVDLWDRVKED